jgi:hypothetical protein
LQSPQHAKERSGIKIPPRFPPRRENALGGGKTDAVDATASAAGADGTRVLSEAARAGRVPYSARPARAADDLRRLRLAHHEAAHAIANYILRGGSTLRLVSIEGTATYGGICLSAPSRVGGLTVDDLDRPLPLVPARLRRVLETHVVATLCGQIAEDLVEPVVRRGSTSAEERAAETVNLLTGRERRSLEAAAKSTGMSDADFAWRGAWLLAGSELAGAQLALLRAVARELVFSPRFLRLLLALVPELLAHSTIGGRRAAAILKAADTKGSGSD